jgi:hypothetical protein
MELLYGNGALSFLERKQREGRANYNKVCDRAAKNQIDLTDEFWREEP